jgi:hypothetical protein
MRTIAAFLTAVLALASGSPALAQYIGEFGNMLGGILGRSHRTRAATLAGERDANNRPL